MRIFLVGDLKGNNGPASVNKALKKVLPQNTMYSEGNNVVRRIIDLLIKTIKSDIVIFSGLSKINIIGFRTARILGKKAAYLMHGHLGIEGKINKTKLEKGIEVEKKVLELAPLIICVSESFMNMMIEKYPRYTNKLRYVNNGIDWDIMRDLSHNNVTRKNNMILSIGGGMPQKNILSLCKAIEHLNENQGYNLELTVIGKNGLDTGKIKGYPFVTYIEQVRKEEINIYYKQAQLYIQNSTFETFGLAPIEAIMCGCNLLISKNVGASVVFNHLQSMDVIDDTNSISEIAQKIKYSINNNNNNNRLIKSIDKEKTSLKAAYQNLLNIFISKRNSK